MNKDLAPTVGSASADAATVSPDSVVSPAGQDIDHAAAIAADLAKPFDRILRKAGDDLYETLMYSVQEYLAENVAYNLRSELDAARRQARSDAKRATEAEANSGALLDALRYLFADYKQLADSGDAGNWSLENTDAGRVALAAIARAEGRS